MTKNNEDKTVSSKNVALDNKKHVDTKDKTVDSKKIEDQIMIVRSLNETQALSTIENLSTSLKMINEIDVLDKLGGLTLNGFFKEVKVNRLEDLKFKDSKLYNVYCKAFCDFVLIPNLHYSKQELEENEPYRYLGLRKVSEIAIANKMFQFIHYAGVTDVTIDGRVAIEKPRLDENGEQIKSCFTDPSSQGKPIEIYVKTAFINSSAKLKRRLNPKGQTPCALSFEKLKEFSNFLLAGESSRVSSNEEKDDTLSTSAKQVDELRRNLDVDMVFTPVDFKLPKDSAERKLQEIKRSREGENLVYLVDSIITKLVSNAEFDTLLRVYLTIATNKDFIKFIKTNYKSMLAAFVEDFGGQISVTDLKDLDLSNIVQINTRLQKEQKETVMLKANKKKVINK